LIEIRFQREADARRKNLLDANGKRLFI